MVGLLDFRLFAIQVAIQVFGTKRVTYLFVFFCIDMTEGSRVRYCHSSARTATLSGKITGRSVARATNRCNAIRGVTLYKMAINSGPRRTRNLSENVQWEPDLGIQGMALTPLRISVSMYQCQKTTRFHYGGVVV